MPWWSSQLLFFISTIVCVSYLSLTLSLSLSLYLSTHSLSLTLYLSLSLTLSPSLYLSTHSLALTLSITLSLSLQKQFFVTEIVIHCTRAFLTHVISQQKTSDPCCELKFNFKKMHSNFSFNVQLLWCEKCQCLFNLLIENWLVIIMADCIQFMSIDWNVIK